MMRNMKLTRGVTACQEPQVSFYLLVLPANDNYYDRPCIYETQKYITFIETSILKLTSSCAYDLCHKDMLKAL